MYVKKCWNIQLGFHHRSTSIFAEANAIDQNNDDQCFADGIFSAFSWHKIIILPIKFEFVSGCLIADNSAFIHIYAWCRADASFYMDQCWPCLLRHAYSFVFIWRLTHKPICLYEAWDLSIIKNYCLLTMLLHMNSLPVEQYDGIKCTSWLLELRVTICATIEST